MLVTFHLSPLPHSVPFFTFSSHVACYLPSISLPFRTKCPFFHIFLTFVACYLPSISLPFRPKCPFFHIFFTLVACHLPSISLPFHSQCRRPKTSGGRQPACRRWKTACTVGEDSLPPHWVGLTPPTSAQHSPPLPTTVPLASALMRRAHRTAPPSTLLCHLEGSRKPEKPQSR